MTNFEKNLEKYIKNDKLKFCPDPAIQERLNNAFNYKVIHSKAKQNSFGQLFIPNLFSNKSFLNLAFLTLFILISINIPKFTNQNKTLIHCDSSIQKINYEDSLIINKAIYIDSLIN